MINDVYNTSMSYFNKKKNKAMYHSLIQKQDGQRLQNKLIREWRSIIIQVDAVISKYIALNYLSSGYSNFWNIRGLVTLHDEKLRTQQQILFGLWNRGRENGWVSQKRWSIFKSPHWIITQNKYIVSSQSCSKIKSSDIEFHFWHLTWYMTI